MEPGHQTLLETFCDWAAELRIEDIPPRVASKLRLQVASAVAAAGADPWHRPSRAVLRACGRPGEALVIATGERRSAADAALTNAAFALSLDWDDYLLSGHTGPSSVLVPLAYASEEGAPLRSLLEAAAAANELMGRLSTACLLGPLNGQMSSYIHNAGAALALGKMLHLDSAALTSAVALALSQPNHCLAPGFWHEDAKTLTAALPIAQGLRAAQMAQAGLRGPRDVLDHPLGLLGVFAFHRFDGLFEGLGQVWFSDTLSFKRYPGTSYISGAVEAALTCSGGQPLDPAAISSVRVETTLLSATLDTLGAAALCRSPLDANAVNFSLRLSVAAALVWGDLRPGLFRPENLARSEAHIRAVAAKVRVVHDWPQTLDLLSASPLGLRMVAHLPPAALARLVAHVRSLRRAADQPGETASRLAPLLPRSPGLLLRLARERRRRVTALDFDASSFAMRQSARVQLRAEGQTRETFVQVPLGACGRNPEEARAVVRWRLEEAFADRVDDLWAILRGEAASVQDLNRAIAGATPPVTAARR